MREKLSRWKADGARVTSFRHGSCCGRGRAAGALAGHKHNNIPAGELAQADVKAFAPPGGYVWEGRSNGSWQGHFRPWPRVSKSWFLYGQRGATLLLLRTLWSQRAEHRGLTKDDIPIPNLYAEDVLEPEG